MKAKAGTKDLNQPKKMGLGGIRDSPDPRDIPYVPPAALLRNLPGKVDLRKQFPPVYNQGSVNSCTANAIAAAMEFDALHQGVKDATTPSRLFVYYNERVMTNTQGKDSGGQIRDGIKSIVNEGDCPESHWPYLEKMVTVKPVGACYKQARSFKALKYERIDHNLDHMKACLASGYPFVFGFVVYSSFQGAAVKSSGHLGMPKKGEKVVGLHAVVACGYDDSKGWFIVRNSWGPGWGLDGYYTMPYEYLASPKLAHDFWTVRVVR
jgi:C1A family cysteine protease